MVVGTLASGGSVLARLDAGYALLSHTPTHPLPTWLAPSPEAIEAAWPWMRAAQRRLVRRLLPGPIVFVTPPKQGIDPAAARVDSRGERFGTSPSRVYALDLSDASGRPALDAGEARERLAQLGLPSLPPPALLVESGPPPSRQGLTIVEFEVGGGVRVLRAGAYEERFVRKQLALNVLVICTGNTCRSPMAAAIGQALADRAATDGTLGGLTVTFHSAGTSAGSGAPATREAILAVQELGYRFPPHSSRPLTRALIADADIVWAMTRSHAAAARAIAGPGVSASKVTTLDPAADASADIADPIGEPASVYSQTARRIGELLAARLKELGT